jgi:ribosomal protein L11 methylase PrmA
MAKASGIFMDVAADWALGFDVDMSALEWAFDNLRHNAAKQGCKNFPSRDDVAANDVFFHEVRRMYEIKMGQVLDKDDYPRLRRHILKVHKRGNTPKN